MLEKLKLEHLEAQLEAVCEQSAQQELDYPVPAVLGRCQHFLARALIVEWQGRHQRGIEARLRQARFPCIKTLEWWLLTGWLKCVFDRGYRLTLHLRRNAHPPARSVKEFPYISFSLIPRLAGPIAAKNFFKQADICLWHC